MIRGIRIINIVDSLSAANFGIWNAAINTADQLKICGHSVELWYFSGPDNSDILPLSAKLLTGCSGDYIFQLILQYSLRADSDIIVTHGCWSKPTKIGYHFSRAGFKWVYVPHGMLEPWSLKQKKIKKFLYLNFLEKPMAKHASVVRAVSQTEADNLKNMFQDIKTEVVGNGLHISKYVEADKIVPVQYLFLGRLHRKKGIFELVEGWLQSTLNNDSRYKLTIAGPDQGELKRIEPLILGSNNIKYIGPVYKESKVKVLSESSFYVLPSYSEGFPISILEAMAFKQICLISKACNFPEAFAGQFAIEVLAEPSNIAKQLQYSSRLSQAEMDRIKVKAHDFITDNHSLKRIANLQINLYRFLLSVPVSHEKVC